MIIRVDNTPRDYVWGSTGDIAKLRGRKPSGGPEAELWLGTHPGSPLVIAEGERANQQTLAELLELNGRPQLPYLLKLLSAASPLSIQVHPTKAQAVAGFARENAAGIPLDAPNRNYKDDSDKPELIVALQDGFVALSGFQPLNQIHAHLSRMREVLVISGKSSQQLDSFLAEIDVRGEAFLSWALEWVLTSAERVALLDEVVEASELLHDELILDIAARYPGDPGLLVAMLLHRVTLRQGEALYLPAGNVHAYIRGFGVELMAASDNVLRGGLTSKFIDVPELLNVADVTPVEIPHLHPTEPTPGVSLYNPDGADLLLACLTPSEGVAADVELKRTSIAVCTVGSVTVQGRESRIELVQGDIVAIFDDEIHLTATGAGQLFLAL